MTTVNLFLAQMRSATDPGENLRSGRRLCREARARGADLVVFPEMFMARPESSRPLADLAEPADGPFCRSLSGLAREFRLAVVAHFWERVEGHRRVHNSLAWYDERGRQVTVYRKLHLFDALAVRESDTMVAGSQLPPVVRFRGLRLGLAICYDLRFPELFRAMALHGADGVLVPAAWYAGAFKEDHWLTLLRSRAVENTLYLAGINQVGPTFCGRSCLFDPFGVLKAQAGEGPEGLVVKLDAERIAQVRSRLPVLRHFRRDLLPFPPAPGEITGDDDES